MKRLLIPAALALGFACCAWAEGPAATEAAAPTEAPFLWEIQGPNARHFVLGSVHMLPQSARPLPVALDAAYAATRALVAETDLDLLGTQELQGRMLGAAREDRPGGLEGRVGKALYRKLQKRARALGMPTPVCVGLRAWFCALALELYPLQQAQFSLEYGVDQNYFTRAREDARPIVTLETPEFQISLFAQMHDALAKQMLAATLDEATYQTPEELYRMWRTGDVRTLEEMVRDLRREYPKLHARILSDRNRAWAEQLAERMQLNVPLLVVVGAAHLPGSDGLLALLKARGLDAKPVTGTLEVPAPVNPE